MKTVALSKPLRGHRGMVEALSFREPTFEDFMTLGDPRVPIISGDRFLWQPVPTLVRDYAERLLVVGPEANLLLMATVGLRDAKAIQETVLSFFTDLDPKPKSDASQENSPSSETRTSEESTV